MITRDYESLDKKIKQIWVYMLLLGNHDTTQCIAKIGKYN